MTTSAVGSPAAQGEFETLEASRRRLIIDAFGIAVSAAAFGFVFGLSAQRAGFLPIEAVAFSTIVFAGAAQFAAVGYIAGGIAWPIIFLLTALLNARHLLYSAALAPWLRGVPLPRRVIIAHLLTDESFALSIAHFTRTGKPDERGYWIAAIGSTFIPWNIATIVGVLAGQEIPGPERFGLDVVFPAAMIGLAAGLIANRRDVVAAVSGAVVAVIVSLAVAPSVGIVAGGLLGPLAGLAAPVPREPEVAALGTVGSAQRYSMPGARYVRSERTPGTDGERRP
jgi:4-azaleucine resistance transporter AzlC